MAVCLAQFAGCSRENFKNEADAAVYEIVNTKWGHNYGPRANYLISDVEPDANEVRLGIPESGMLNLARAVAIATAGNRDYQQQRESLYLQALDLTGERHRYARQWFASLGLIAQREGEQDDIHTENTLGVDQELLFKNGVVFTIGAALDWALFFGHDPASALQSILSAEIAVPLLGRGAGRVAWEELTQAERDVVYQIRSFCRFRKIFVVSITSDYYRLLKLRDLTTNTKNSWESKTKLTRRLRMEAAEGRVARFQVDQAEQSELSSKETYLRSVRSYDRSLDAFKDRLALSPSSPILLDPNALNAILDGDMEMPGYTLEEAIDIALKCRLDLMNTSDQVNDALRKVELAAEGLGIQLGITGRARMGSRPDTDFTRIQFHEGSYALGLTGNVPLDRLLERNAYREATITLAKHQRGREQTVARIELEVREAYRRLEEEAESYQTALKSLELARTRVKVSPLLWAGQRMNTRDLLEAQDALLAAENSLTNARTNYAIVKLEFFRDIGVLNVQPDGMWMPYEDIDENNSAPPRQLQEDGGMP